MAPDKLTGLQKRTLRILAALRPPATLTGGGALAGIYLGHRTTRDLDLFWRPRPDLGTSAVDAEALLRRDGLDVRTLRTSPTFAELRVSDGAEVCIVDLVAEPFAALEPPQQTAIGPGVAIAVDSMHEILVAKLTALLGRRELRDLVDVRALLDAGLDLDAALRDAPSKDGGFSPLTLAWVLESFDPRPLALALGWNEEQAAGLDRFRRELVQRLIQSGRPPR